jgi:hypothetical protein
MPCACPLWARARPRDPLVALLAVHWRPQWHRTSSLTAMPRRATRGPTSSLVRPRGALALHSQKRPRQAAQATVERRPSSALTPIACARLLAARQVPATHLKRKSMSITANKTCDAAALLPAQPCACETANRPCKTALWNYTPDAVLPHLPTTTARPRHVCATEGATA